MSAYNVKLQSGCKLLKIETYPHVKNCRTFVFSQTLRESSLKEKFFSGCPPEWDEGKFVALDEIFRGQLTLNINGPTLDYSM